MPNLFAKGKLWAVALPDLDNLSPRFREFFDFNCLAFFRYQDTHSSGITLEMQELESKEAKDLMAGREAFLR